jgi:hypothetical protein
MARTKTSMSGKHPWAQAIRPVKDPRKVKVTMKDYLALSDETNKWRQRALDAESRLHGSGDVLGEGRFRIPPVKKQPAGFEQD